MFRRFSVRWFAALIATSFIFSAGVFAAHKPKPDPKSAEKHRFSIDKTGSVATQSGQHLRFITDIGNVTIHTQDTNQVTYRVRIETDSSAVAGQKLLERFIIFAHNTPDGVLLRGQVPVHDARVEELWISWDVTVPREFSVELNTGAGNVQVDDIAGRLLLSTLGGNVILGNVDGSARIETGGGHVVARDVTGDMVAGTGGGNISAGHIGGSAILKTDGGHIRLTSVAGAGHLETAGGNISLEGAGAELVAATGGGQIEVGEASGSIRAQTAGGGIRVARVAGTTKVETASGSIYLTQVQSAVRASTGAGGITAWFGPDVKLTENSELDSSQGDIVVYLPKMMPVTIDARISQGDDHQFSADPAFPIKVTYVGTGAARTVRAEGTLNGGGILLRLRTVAGNIKLVLSDTCQQLQKQVYKQQMEQLKRQIKALPRPPQPPQPDSQLATPKPAEAPKPPSQPPPNERE